ncbi:MAG: 3-oxoacyl-ACP synthase III [Desulfuromonadaceae bacterium]|nr:3-oxoacyl-ACP synthase III [Desulfuromonadaceae bacterium]
MKYNNVYLNSICYELPPVVVTSHELEQHLAPLYQKLHIHQGQLQALTGIRERRWWLPHTPLSQGAIAAGKKALSQSGIDAADIGALVYTGVCRELYEPATACRVAHGLGVGGTAFIHDISNACLGVLNGIIDIANRIELGQIRAGMVVSCESARELNETVIRRLLAREDMEFFSHSIATLTGGSGAAALVISDGSFPNSAKHKLLGAVNRSAPQHHELCRWGVEEVGEDLFEQFMHTDAVAVLNNGVELGKHTWDDFLRLMEWDGEDVERVVCHQVGEAHQKTILRSMGVALEKDFATYPFLGNIGTVSLPLTAAMGAERGHIRAGQKVAFLGIGSGLNCMMLGVEW